MFVPAILGLLLSGHARGQVRDSAPYDAVRDEAVDADKAQRARELMREGLAEWEKGNLEGARDALVKAWDVSPNPNIVSALAEIDMKLGRYREAADYWQVYLARYPPDYETAQGKFAECRRNLGKLRIHVGPADAVFTLDGQIVPRPRLDADVWVDPGTHGLRAELHGASTMQQVSIQAGESKELSLVVPATVRAAPVARPPPEPLASRPSAVEDAQGGGIPARTIVLISGAALTAAAATVGVIYTVKANQASDDAAHFEAMVHAKADPMLTDPSSVCSPLPGVPPAECTDLERAVDQRQRATNVAISSYVAAGAFGAGTLVTYFLWPDSKRNVASKRGARVSVAPLLVGRGVQLRVAF